MLNLTLWFFAIFGASVMAYFIVGILYAMYESKKHNEERFHNIVMDLKSRVEGLEQIRDNQDKALGLHRESK